jgi:hypothetical protein
MAWLSIDYYLVQYEETLETVSRRRRQHSVNGFNYECY